MKECPKCKKPLQSYLGFNAREPEWFCENELCGSDDVVLKWKSAANLQERLKLWNIMSLEDRIKVNENSIKELELELDMDTMWAEYFNPTRSELTLPAPEDLARLPNFHSQRTQQTASSVIDYSASAVRSGYQALDHASSEQCNSPEQEDSHPRTCMPPSLQYDWVLDRWVPYSEE